MLTVVCRQRKRPYEDSPQFGSDANVGRTALRAQGIYIYYPLQASKVNMLSVLSQTQTAGAGPSTIQVRTARLLGVLRFVLRIV